LCHPHPTQFHRPSTPGPIAAVHEFLSLARPSATQSPREYPRARGSQADAGRRIAPRETETGSQRGAAEAYLVGVSSITTSVPRGKEEAEGRQESPARASIALPATAHMPTAYSLRAPPSASQQRLRLPLPPPPPPLPFCPGGGAARRRRGVGVASASASPFDELHARGRPVHGPSKVSQPPSPTSGTSPERPEPLFPKN
jgi:hypothetical protein